MKTKHETKKETSAPRLLCEANADDGDTLVVEREAACERGRGTIDVKNSSLSSMFYAETPK